MSFSTTAASSAETCMSLTISCINGAQSKLFESYRATGRAPPCPPYPAEPTARAAQRLPPLFVPTPFSALDQFVSISCRPEFAGHSVEELRLSCLRIGAELTSPQIFSALTAAPTAAPVNPLLPSSLRPTNSFLPSSSSSQQQHPSPFAP
ncbi:hypothetical protein DFH09DRAFT_1317815 [Mycena vulgaris]|nr:hypothetical protein DFH09DRAFT_1317815 [Mycena vulgaris]